MTAEEALNKSKGVLNGYIKCTYVQLYAAPYGRVIISLQHKDIVGIETPIVTMTSAQYARRNGKYVPVTLAQGAIKMVNRILYNGKFKKRGAITQGYQQLEDFINRKLSIEVWVLESAISWHPQEYVEPEPEIEPEVPEVEPEEPEPEPEPEPQPKKKTAAKKENKKLLALLLAASSLLFNS